MNQAAIVQQMMATGSPNWWNINNMRPPPSSQNPSSSSSSPQNLFPHQYTSPPPPPPPSWSNSQEFPESWGQLLLGGLVGEEKCDISNMQQLLSHHNTNCANNNNNNNNNNFVGVKQESPLINSYVYSHGNVELFHQPKPASCSHINNNIPINNNSSPKSCVSSSGGNKFDFSSKSEAIIRHHRPPDHSSECNSTATGGAAKKARVHPTSTQSTFKVRKEKLGDRITALHQLVSPFGKTDTASVLLEAIGYIRFLRSQIEALSLPYLGTGSPNMRQHHQQPDQGDRTCLFPEDPGQECHETLKKDLRSRGLCLVPISCTLQVGSDNGADYWAPAAFGASLQ